MRSSDQVVMMRTDANTTTFNVQRNREARSHIQSDNDQPFTRHVLLLSVSPFGRSIGRQLQRVHFYRGFIEKDWVRVLAVLPPGP